MKEFNRHRVVFYGKNDSASGLFRDRIIELLTNPEAYRLESVNEAIEAFQCKLTVDQLPGLFDGVDYELMQKSSRSIFGRACQYINGAIEQNCIEEMFEGVEAQYVHLFWWFLDTCGASKKLTAESVKNLLDRHPECICDVLELKSFVEAFGTVIRDVLIENPRPSAELIISRLATQPPSKRALVLPAELTNDDIDTIMCAYLQGNHPSLNYVGILASWPFSKVDRYKPSPNTVILAKRTQKRGMEELSSTGMRFRFGTGVSIDEQQEACKGITRSGLDVKFTFSAKWLGLYLDNPTIMNNCIYLFDYVDHTGIMTMPAREHDEPKWMKCFGLHARGEYRVSSVFHRRNGLALTETIAYADFLKRHGTRLESALEWVFNCYFEEELKLKGFSLSLPTEGTTWLDKCKSIGPEIERAIKAFSIYAKNREIDDEYFRFESVKDFKSLPTLSKNKYVIAGERFDEFGSYLFSDQSPLAFIEDGGTKDHCFFDLLQHQNISRSSFGAHLYSIIDRLLNEDFIVEGGQSNLLKPAIRALCLRAIWENGAISRKYCDKDKKRAIGSLVDEKVLDYGNTLFTPDEAAYLNYVYNDAVFSNSLGLRNRYNHASAPIDDPNSEAMRMDYYQLLTILIAITLKISEELNDHTGLGGQCDFVDWPMYDASIYETAAQLGCFGSGSAS